MKNFGKAAVNLTLKSMRKFCNLITCTAIFILAVLVITHWSNIIQLSDLTILSNLRTDSGYDVRNTPMKPHTGQGSVLPSGLETGRRISTAVNFTSFPAALKAKAGPNNDILLALIDTGVIDMAFNFYETSATKLAAGNFLYLSSSKKACSMLQQANIPCHLYMEDTASDKPSTYMSKDFLRKMNIRTYMILEALKLGYNVLHTDVDIVFFDDPFKEIHEACDSKNCNLAALWDSFVYNAGFLYVKASPDSIRMYERMKHIAEHSPKTDDQTGLNTAVRELSKAKGSHFKAVRLSTSKFLCGLTYFENGHRTFAGDNPCKNCVVVHNNWIVSMEAKVYRFKEVHMWKFDQNKYYSNLYAKYLVFGNPLYFGTGEKTKAKELGALKSAMALGKLLNRTVILPRFHCGKNGGSACSLISFIKVIKFDKIFKNSYREHTFLSHTLVPETIKESLSQIVMIGSEESNVTLNSSSKPTDVRTFVPKNPKGATSEEVIKWFGDYSASVLRFHCLYGGFYKFTNDKVNTEFESNIQTAFTSGKYRQF